MFVGLSLSTLSSFRRGSKHGHARTACWVGRSLDVSSSMADARQRNVVLKLCFKGINGLLRLKSKLDHSVSGILLDVSNLRYEYLSDVLLLVLERRMISSASAVRDTTTIFDSPLLSFSDQGVSLLCV